MTTRIVIKGDIPKNPVVIEGFPSKGFVSTIATNHMINELDMKLIGCIESDQIPSITVIHNSKPYRPIRIYAKNNIILIFSEIAVPLRLIIEFSNSVKRWFDEIKPEQVILLAGISGVGTEKEHEILGVTNDKDLKRKLKNLDVTELKDAVITGVSSDLLLYCEEKDIPTISLMAETSYVPDPLAAASVIKILNGLLDLNIETEDLVKTGVEIEKKFKEIAEQLKRGRESYKKVEGYSPMYG